MLEHNDKKYVKFAQALKRAKICCCYGSCLNFKLPVEPGTEPTVTEFETTAGTVTKMDEKIEGTTTEDIMKTDVDLHAQMDMTMTQTHLGIGNHNVQEFDSQRTTTQDLEQEAKINKKQIAALKRAIK